MIEDIVQKLSLIMPILFVRRQGTKRKNFSISMTKIPERPMFIFDLIPKTLDFEVTNICQIKVIKVR